MEKALAEAVRTRAGYRCEYWEMPQGAFRFRFRFPIDHILVIHRFALARSHCKPGYCNRLFAANAKR